MNKFIQIISQTDSKKYTGAIRPTRFNRFLSSNKLLLATFVPRDTLNLNGNSIPHFHHIELVNSPFILNCFYKLCSVRKTCFVYISGAPFAPFILSLISLIKPNLKFILEYRDPWANDVMRPKIGFLHAFAQYFYEVTCLLFCHRVIVISDEVKNSLPLIALFKRKVISSDTEFSIKELDLSFKQHKSTICDLKYSKNNNLSVLHLGNVDHLMSIEEFAVLSNYFNRKPIYFNLYGSFNADALSLFNKLSSAGNVKIHSRVCLSEAYSLMANADVLLLLGSKTSQRLHRKVFEYMYTNKPILYLGSRNSPTYKVISSYPRLILVSSDIDQIPKECNHYMSLMRKYAYDDSSSLKNYLPNPLFQYDENIVFSSIVSTLS